MGPHKRDSDVCVSERKERERVCEIKQHLPWSLWESLTGSPTLVLIPGCLLSGTMAAKVVVALLALASLCAASDLDCKELVKPLVLDSHSPVSMTVCCTDTGR